MTKEQHIDYWINTAEEDWTTIGVLFAMSRYLHSLFWAHLMLEKLAKALWIKYHADDIPPKDYSIVELLEESNVDLGNFNTNFLTSFNVFQLSNQTPDLKFCVYQVCTNDFTRQELEKVKDIRTLLLDMLP